MATAARESRQSVQFFDVDLFRNKLENFMRRQSNEMCAMTNTKKRKLDERWSDDDKGEEMELAADDYRDDLVYQFGKRQCRQSSYYPLDESDLKSEREISPLLLPSPVTVPARESNQPWPFFDFDSMDAVVAAAGGAATQTHEDEEGGDMSLATRRKLSGYSEVSPTTTYPAYMDDDDDSWMSPCPPLSRGSLSHSSSYNSHPQTPTYTADLDTSTLPATTSTTPTTLPQIKENIGLDITSMEPHERTLVAALAPEKLEKAALIQKAFKQSDKLVNQFALEHQPVRTVEGDDVLMDDGEYDQVFGELMHV